jgi:alkylhydroperoxidase family enzyme
MPHIEPIPLDQLDGPARRRLDAGLATGMYTTTLPLQVMAHSPAALQAMDESYKAVFRAGVLDPRIQELVRLRSAQLNTCEPCAASRKDGTVDESDVACLLDPDPSRFDQRELLALRFLDLLATDHHAIDTGTFRELAECFSAAEIVELGWFCAQAIGVHRLMHVLAVTGDVEPVVRLDHTRRM